VLKFLGWFFLIVGALLTVTIVFIGFGVPFMVVGALLLIASAVSSRRREREQF
jgi:hypothetical protein